MCNHSLAELLWPYEGSGHAGGGCGSFVGWTLVSDEEQKRQ